MGADKSKLISTVSIRAALQQYPPRSAIVAGARDCARISRRAYAIPRSTKQDRDAGKRSTIPMLACGAKPASPATPRPRSTVEEMVAPMCRGAPVDRGHFPPRKTRTRREGAARSFCRRGEWTGRNSKSRHTRKRVPVRRASRSIDDDSWNTGSAAFADFDGRRVGNHMRLQKNPQIASRSLYQCQRGNIAHVMACLRTKTTARRESRAALGPSAPKYSRRIAPGESRGAHLPRAQPEDIEVQSTSRRRDAFGVPAAIARISACEVGVTVGQGRVLDWWR